MLCLALVAYASNWPMHAYPDMSQPDTGLGPPALHRRVDL